VRIWALAQDGTVAARLPICVFRASGVPELTCIRALLLLTPKCACHSKPRREFCTHSYTFCRCSVLGADTSSNAQVGVLHP
jgi:hypothetical protein